MTWGAAQNGSRAQGHFTDFHRFHLCSLPDTLPVSLGRPTSYLRPWRKGDWSLALSTRRSPSFGGLEWKVMGLETRRFPLTTCSTCCKYWNFRKTQPCVQQSMSSLRTVASNCVWDSHGFTASRGFKVSGLCFPAGLHLRPLLDPISSLAQTGDRQGRPSNCSEIY